MTTLVAVLGRGVVTGDDPAAVPVVTADDLGLTRGDGCFDAMRVVVEADGSTRIDHRDGHLSRFLRSTTALELPIEPDGFRREIERLVDEALQAWDQPGEAALRVIATRGREAVPGGPVTALVTIARIDPQSLTARSAGISVCTLTSGRAARAYADAAWLLGGVKTLSYGSNVAAAREAQRRGADDVLFVSSDGLTLEAPRAAFIWLDQTGDRPRLLSTCLRDTGVLASVTQAAIFSEAAAADVATGFDLLPAADLHRHPGWLVSAVRGVAPILTIDGQALPSATEWTARLSHWAGFEHTTDPEAAPPGGPHR